VTPREPYKEMMSYDRTCDHINKSELNTPTNNATWALKYSYMGHKKYERTNSPNMILHFHTTVKTQWSSGWCTL